MDVWSTQLDRINPFLISTILLAIGLYFQCKLFKSSRFDESSEQSISNCSTVGSIFKSSNTILILFVTSLICFLILESYYHEQCPVDPLRYNQTLQIFTINITVLKQMQVDHVAYFGTLLYILRQSLFAIWDQDSDILIIKPENVDQFLDDFTNTINNISIEYKVIYNEHRDLIQVEHGKAHGDIWLYTLKNISTHNYKILTNYDYTTKRPILDFDLIFPSHNVNWLGFQVPIPHKEHSVAQYEFGEDYMTPKYHIIHQCLENIFTYKISVARSFTYLTILILGNIIAISIKKAMHNKEYCGRIKRKSINVIVQLVPIKFIDLYASRFNIRSSDISLPETKANEVQKLLSTNDSD
eukprot:175691_1